VSHVYYINLAPFLIIFPPVRMKVGKNALMYAAEAGHLELVKKLLEHGIDVNATSMVRINILGQFIEKYVNRFVCMSVAIERRICANSSRCKGSHRCSDHVTE
jgi:hypothetical protein